MLISIGCAAVGFNVEGDRQPRKGATAGKSPPNKHRYAAPGGLARPVNAAITGLGETARSKHGKFMPTSVRAVAPQLFVIAIVVVIVIDLRRWV